MPVPDGDLDRAALDGVAAAFHAEHRGLYGYDFAGDPTPAGRVGQPAGLRHRADHPPRDPARSRRSSVSRPRRAVVSTSCDRRTRPVCFDAEEGYVDTAVLLARTTSRRVPRSSGPAIIEEYGSTVPVHPGFTATVDDFGNLLVRRTNGRVDA